MPHPGSDRFAGVIVSHAQRTLFVHVQKTGGITVEGLLLDQQPGAEKLKDLPGRKHARLGAALRQHPEVADYWTFGFVRNPWARMWSWYSMIQQRRESADAGDAWVTQRISRNRFWAGVIREIPDFEAFVMHGPELFPRMRVPQVRYFRAPGKQADFIGRTETLDADLRSIASRLGIEPPAVVPRENASRSGDYRTHFTPAMRDRVGELYVRDLEEFGYTFD